MKELAEREVKIGLSRDAKKVVDDIEQTAREMTARGWRLVDTQSDEVLGSVYLFFEREVPDASKT